MTKLYTKLKQLLNKVLAFLPSPLPVGMSQFNTWANSIILLLGPGFENVPEADKQFVLANSIMHLSHTTSYKPKHYFISILRKGAANQVASQVFQEIKLKQQQAQEAAKQAEATATPTQVADGNSETKKV